jgi:hypothetical protein
MNCVRRWKRRSEFEGMNETTLHTSQTITINELPEIYGLIEALELIQRNWRAKRETNGTEREGATHPGTSSRIRM